MVLWASEIEPLVRFLATVAGAKIGTRHPGFASLEAGRTAIEVHADEAYRGHPWFDALAREGAARGIGAELRFRCDDVQRSWTAALDAGAVPILAPTDSGTTCECVVMGPDGYLFSFWSNTSGS